MQDIFKIGLWAIEHEEEILARLPPEKQPETILALAKMREGINKLKNLLEELQG